MGMETVVINLNPLDQRWISFISSHPCATIFHHSAWVNLLAECYGYRSFIITLIDEDERISAGLPMLEVCSTLTGKRWVSLPFTDYCQPLYQDQNAFENLTLRLVALSQDNNNPGIEVRWDLPMLPITQRYTKFVRHTLNLDRDLESISKSLHRSQRQNIKIAEKNGVQIERGEGLDHVNEFYRLHCLTRRRQGVPVQPWRFFELLNRQLIARGLGFILLAYSDKQCLAAGLFLNWQKTLIYKYASSSEEGKNLRPNHLLTWTAIRWGCENGYKVFDFGRADRANAGLRTFKNRWGADETPLAYSRLSGQPLKLSTGRIETCMQKIIKNSPLWVCRLAGEVLYRHFG